MTAPDGIDLRQITDADIYIGDELAAKLTRESGDEIHFSYVTEPLPIEGRIRDRSVAVTNILDKLVEAAHPWPERCEQIGFDPRQTDLLAKMLTTRIRSLE